MASRLFLICGILLVTTQLAYGHGYLQLPKSRNYIANLQGKDYCPHCLSSGGPSIVQSLTPGGLFPTPTETITSAVRHTICGEAANIAAANRKYNPYPVPSASGLPEYQPGQVIDIEVVITAHHRGHFEFRLCDASKLADPTTVNWACMTTLLQRVSVAGEMSSVDVNHPERYYLEPECQTGYSKTIKMKYQLPSNLTCERCIMQWWWVSANTCNPPGYGARSPMPVLNSGCDWWQSNLPACGSSYPEEFWNCADIRIAGAAAPGTSTVAPKAPPPAVPVAPPAKPAAPVAPVAPPAKPAAPVAAPSKPVAAPSKPAAPIAPPAKPVAAPSRPAAPSQPAAPTNAACAILGGQCGGAGWAGPTCCQSGKCYAYIPSYSQCRADGCPAGWLCQSSADRSMLTSAVEWAKRFFE